MMFVFIDDKPDLKNWGSPWSSVGERKGANRWGCWPEEEAACLLPLLVYVRTGLGGGPPFNPYIFIYNY